MRISCETEGSVSLLGILEGVKGQGLRWLRGFVGRSWVERWQEGRPDSGGGYDLGWTMTREPLE